MLKMRPERDCPDDGLSHPALELHSIGSGQTNADLRLERHPGRPDPQGFIHLWVTSENGAAL